MHQNYTDNVGYRRFLARVTERSMARLLLLAVMFNEAGFASAAYDLYYAHYLCCSIMMRNIEAIEHVYRLGREGSDCCLCYGQAAGWV